MPDAEKCMKADYIIPTGLGLAHSLKALKLALVNIEKKKRRKKKIPRRKSASAKIVLDTETTGMDPFKGDRIIEIGAVEFMGHLPTGKTLQIYINPGADIPL